MFRKRPRGDESRALAEDAHAAQVEIVRSMPVAGRYRQDLVVEAMWCAAQQSVQDSEAIHQALHTLELHQLPPRLKAAVQEALVTVERLRALRPDWMRYRPEVEQQRGMPGLTLLLRVEQGHVPGVAPQSPWPHAQEAAAAMQIAAPALYAVNEALEEITGQRFSEALFPA